MPTVAVNAPKTPVTQGSSGVAAATLPNVCKMPGPPAPFVPTPLPNIGKSDNSPQGYSTTVAIEGQPVAIKGATFNSIGDVASQGTGGGLISSNVQGPTSFVGPGSMDVKVEGKNVQLLGDPMLNNGGPSGSPANAATMAGVIQAPGTPAGTEAEQTGSLKVAVVDICTGDPIDGATIEIGRARMTSDGSGLATFSSRSVGAHDIEASKHFSEADYSKFLVQYPRVMWKKEARSTVGSVAEVTAGGTTDVELKMVVYRLVNTIIFKRRKIRPTGADKYGHWWTEIDGGESYGWWPKYPLGSPDNQSSAPPTPPDPLPPDAGRMAQIQSAFDSAVYSAQSAWHRFRESGPIQTMVGVAGELNGQTSFGGTPTEDPHQGDAGDEEYQPVIDDCRPDSEIKDKARSFAAGYRGGWSWRFELGTHCHTFQKQMIAECNLDKFKVIK
jgi:hypothetical protein